MTWYYDLIILVVLCIIIAIIIGRTHKRLLRMWKEVSSKEIVFYRQLEKVVKLFYEYKEILRTEENEEFIRLITRYRKKRIRSLLLGTRQEIYTALTIIYDVTLEQDHTSFPLLKKEYKQMQIVRRVYNSQVLIYNQTISVFPTRYLALRMNLELKEYFG